MSEKQDGVLERALGRLEGKMDLLLTNINTHLLEDTARFHLIDERVNKIEKKVFTFTGALAVVLGLFHIVINYFKS